MLTNHFRNKGYKVHGDWLHGPCVYPKRHQHGDRNPSFGYNMVTGYGHCFVCGTLLTKDICDQIGLNPADAGGLLKGKQPAVKVISHPKLEVAPDTPNIPQQAAIPTEMISKLPSWLEEYVNWAGAAGNQTPLIFCQAVGLWLLSLAIGRRLYG
jgi:hypothetical protein